MLMGHQVEYLIDVQPVRARAWLASLDGWWADPKSPDEVPYGKFQWFNLSLHTRLGPTACQVCVIPIKYSWLIADHAPALEQIARLENWLSESLPTVQAVRIDELLRLDWESQTGREWQEWSNPAEALRHWLLTSGQEAAHFRLLPDKPQHTERCAGAERPFR
jgi:hypothetical protein